MKSYLILSVLIFGFIFGCTTTEAPSDVAEPTVEEPVQCSDGDGGQVETVSSAVAVGGVSHQDSCEDPANVREYYCTDGDVGSIVIECSEGTVCDAGACIVIPEAPPETQPLCSDSDGGDDVSTHGVVSYEGSDYSDTCQGAYDILEYYCENDAMQQRTANCGVGSTCEEGACTSLDTTCSDTDEEDEAVGGTATLYAGGMVILSARDSCTSENTRLEFYCEGNSVKNKTEDCLGDEYCYEGVCLPNCEDFDSGEDYLTPSYVRSKEGTFEDYCSDSEYLTEYYCMGDNAVGARNLCGLACHEGKCIESGDISCEEPGGKAARLMFDDIVIEEKEDVCEDYETALDYLCIDDSIEYEIERCDDDEICVEGRCEGIDAEGCYDMDVDDDAIHVKSYVVMTTNVSVDKVLEDECFTDIIVSEAMCELDSKAVDFITCPTDEKCVDGACAYPYVCTETNTGSPYERGEVTLSEDGVTISTERDLCSNDSTQRKVYCTEDDRVGYELVSCPSGTACDSGEGICK